MNTILDFIITLLLYTIVEYMKTLLFALPLMLIAVSCNNSKDANTEFNQQKEEVNKQKQKAEEHEVAGRHKNDGQKDHKGAR